MVSAWLHSLEPYSSPRLGGLCNWLDALPCKVAAPWGLTMMSHSCHHCLLIPCLELCPSYSHDSPPSLRHLGPPLWALICPTKWKSCWLTSSFYSTPYKISQRKELPDSRLLFEMEIIGKTNYILKKRDYSVSPKRTMQDFLCDSGGIWKCG